MSKHTRKLKRSALKDLAQGDGITSAVAASGLRTGKLADTAGKTVTAVTVVASGLAGVNTVTASPASASETSLESVTQQGPPVASAGNPNPNPKPNAETIMVYESDGAPQTVEETNAALGHKGPYTGTIPQDTGNKPVTGGLVIDPPEDPGSYHETETPYPLVDPSSYEANHPDKGFEGSPAAVPGLTETIVGAAPVVAAAPAAGATALAAPLVLTGAMLADAQTVFDQGPPGPSSEALAS